MWGMCGSSPGAAAVEVDLIVSVRKSELRCCSQTIRVAAPQLQNNGMLFLWEPQEPAVRHRHIRAVMSTIPYRCTHMEGMRHGGTYLSLLGCW